MASQRLPYELDYPNVVSSKDGFSLSGPSIIVLSRREGHHEDLPSTEDHLYYL